MPPEILNKVIAMFKKQEMPAGRVANPKKDIVARNILARPDRVVPAPTPAEQQAMSAIDAKIAQSPELKQILRGKNIAELHPKVLQVAAEIVDIEGMADIEARWRRFEDVQSRLDAMAHDHAATREARGDAMDMKNKIRIYAQMKRIEIPQTIKDERNQNGTWLYKKDARGNIVGAEDEVDAGGRVVRNKSTLRDKLTVLQEENKQADDRGLEHTYRELIKFVDDSNGAYTRQDLLPFRERMTEIGDIFRERRWDLTVEKIHDIQTDTTKRDEMFYDLIKPVLDAPDEESHKTFGLYQVSSLDAFLTVVGSLTDGEKLMQRYNQLQNSIFAFHDLDLQARSAGGDIKSFKGAATYFQNAYAEMATTDPIVVAMMQSYEQALKMIRDNNDGYIPPSLVSYDTLKSLNYWDELAKHIFEEKVKANLIHDYARLSNGLGKVDSTNNAYELGDIFTEKNLTEQQNRIIASMRMAKGMGILNNRLLEIFAFSKTPGYENPESGITTSGNGAGFASKAYEGISRWFNPMADMFGKFRMGDKAYAGFFSLLLGRNDSKISSMDMVKDFLSFTPNEHKEMCKAAAQGVLEEWLEIKYPGKYAGKLNDATGEFAFSGRMGPHSGWGIADSTIGFNDIDRERLGGAIRLGLVKNWAKEIVKKRPEWDSWTPAIRQEKINDLENTYKAWVWVQTALRSPTIVAGEVRVKNEEYFADKTHPMKRKLRSVIIKNILGINVEEDVASGKKPDEKKMELAERISILESDVMIAQQAALTGGVEGRPRNIQDTDFLHIKGDATYKAEGQVVTISEVVRREQAMKYANLVREQMLGQWTVDQWQQNLGVTYDKGRISIANGFESQQILRDANALISNELMNKKQAVHMGIEDLQWGSLDLSTLGTRHWARRANDLEARANTVMAMTEYLGELRKKPDRKALAKGLEAIYRAELAHDPNSAHKFVYLWAEATGNFYRQSKMAEFPMAGKLLARGKEVSINQMVHGKDAEFWSINNEKQWVDEVEQATNLPHSAVDEEGLPDNFSVESLEKRLVATKGAAYLEIAMIGLSLAILATVFTGFTTSLDEDKKSGH